MFFNPKAVVITETPKKTYILEWISPEERNDHWHMVETPTLVDAMEMARKHFGGGNK